MALGLKYWLGFGVGVTSFLTGTLLAKIMDNRKYIPTTDKVEQGNVIPSKLEIKVEDIRKDGKKETMLIYDGKSYLFTLDDIGRPMVQDYEIKPIEIQPKNYRMEAEEKK